MKQNKESLRTAMDRRLSFLDELPSCRAAVQQRIAQEEEPEMKKFSLGFVIAMALVLVSVVGVAAGLLLSPRVTAAQAADRALEAKYGVTQEMQTFFYRTEEELDDGTIKVTYTGNEGMQYPLGIYTALVKNGKAEISWNHDGENTAGGYDAEIWGLDQLKVMMAESTDEKKKMAFLERAKEITDAHSTPEPVIAPMDEFQMIYYQADADKNSALEARKLTEQEMFEIGREFIISSSGLNEEQVSRLELYTGSEKENGNWFYGILNGKPCFLVEYLLYMPYTTEMEIKGEERPRAEKDGYYIVYINVEDGTVEQYEYNSALGGIG